MKQPQKLLHYLALRGACSSLEIQRLLAHQLSALGVQAYPQTRDIEAALLGIIHIVDPPGALLIGHGTSAPQPGVGRIPDQNQEDALDAMTVDSVKTIPPGSSAGGGSVLDVGDYAPFEVDFYFNRMGCHA